jgi:hypothetical protein
MTGRFWEILVIPVLQILEDSEKTGNTSIADTGRFWKILVIPVLQILEDSGKYWLYQYCRYWSLYLPLVLGSAQSCQITLPIYIKL